jgi:hypothetical protein
MAEDLTIPEWHKEEVRRRMQNTKEEDHIPWEIAKEQIRNKKSPKE